MAQVNKKYRLIDELLSEGGISVLETTLKTLIAEAKKDPDSDVRLAKYFRIREYVMAVKDSYPD